MNLSVFQKVFLQHKYILLKSVILTVSATSFVYNMRAACNMVVNAYCNNIVGTAVLREVLFYIYELIMKSVSTRLLNVN